MKGYAMLGVVRRAGLKRSVKCGPLDLSFVPRSFTLTSDVQYERRYWWRENMILGHEGCGIVEVGSLVKTLKWAIVSW